MDREIDERRGFQCAQASQDTTLYKNKHNVYTMYKTKTKMAWSGLGLREEAGGSNCRRQEQVT